MHRMHSVLARTRPSGCDAPVFETSPGSRRLLLKSPTGQESENIERSRPGAESPPQSLRFRVHGLRAGFRIINTLTKAACSLDLPRYSPRRRRSELTAAHDVTTYEWFLRRRDDKKNLGNFRGIRR